MKARLVFFVLLLCPAARIAVGQPQNSVVEPFTWSGGHAATIHSGASTTVWWNPDVWDVRGDTTYIAVAAPSTGYHTDIHKAQSADPTDGEEDNTIYAVGGNGSPGVAAMRMDFQGISSARLRNPMLISAMQPGVVSFYASRFLTTAHWWEIAITPTGAVTGAEQTAVPSVEDGLEGPFAEPPGGGTPGPGHRPAMDSINVIATGGNDVPCSQGWQTRFAVTRSVSGATTDVYNPVTSLSQLMATNPNEVEELYLWRLEFRPSSIDLLADLDKNGTPELVESFPVSIPWSEVYVHFMSVTYEADHHPQAPCYLGSIREFHWKNLAVSPLKYARTVVHPKESGTSNVPRATGWLSYDIRDIQRHTPPVNGVPQPNPVAYDTYTSLLACNVAAFYCPSPAASLNLLVDVPAQSLVQLKRAQLVYDIKSAISPGVATLSVNGQAAGVMPGHDTVPGAAASDWAHRSIDIGTSFLHSGTNSVDIALGGDVELDRLQIELDSDLDVPAVSIAFPGSPTICPGATMLTLTASPVNGTGTYSSYQWLLDGAPIAGANVVTYDATVTGTYTVTVTDSASVTSPPSGGVTVTSDVAAPAVTPPPGLTIVQSLCG